MRYKSKPQDSKFLADPAESFVPKTKVQSSSMIKTDNKEEARFQFNIELLCSPEEVIRYNLKSFFLASTEEEKCANRHWTESLNVDNNTITLTTTVLIDEPKALHYQIPGSESSTIQNEDLKPVRIGNTSHTESFIPIKPSIQIGQRLGWPTEGYFYHFIDDELENEYKILGDNKWAFSITESTNELLKDDLVSKQTMTTILLPYKKNNKEVDRQHLLYKKEKLTNYQWDNEVNADWLDKYACLLNINDIVSARTEPIVNNKLNENNIHIVKAGDSLSKIANEHGSTLNDILDLNPHYKSNPNVISIGDEVVVQANQEETDQPNSHICQLDPKTNQRESWGKIAAKYGLAAKKLLELNSHYNDDPTC